MNHLLEIFKCLITRVPEVWVKFFKDGRFQVQVPTRVSKGKKGKQKNIINDKKENTRTPQHLLDL